MMMIVSQNQTTTSHEMMMPMKMTQKSTLQLNILLDDAVSVSEKLAAMKRFTLTSSNAQYANASRNFPSVNNQNLSSKSSRSKHDTPSYMDLGDCDQQCRHCGCLFWVLPRIDIEASRWQRQGKKVTMNAYYKYQLHPQTKEFGLIFKGG
nr:hypothetical protein [Tanacetum cinerariifolium]